MTISHTKLKLTEAHMVYEIMLSILNTEEENDRQKEHFWILGLNVRNVIQYIELSTLGTLTSSVIHPRETFRLAIKKAVASIVCCHNHPSGDTEPSREDLLITDRLVESGKILGIKVLDHIIIGESGFTSLKEKGLIP